MCVYPTSVQMERNKNMTTIQKIVIKSNYYINYLSKIYIMAAKKHKKKS